MPKVTIVIPCYNEEPRFSSSKFQEFVITNSLVNFIFVNDGSTDNTITILERLCQRVPHRFELLNFLENHGKGEAVRQGLLKAIGSSTEHVGYWDADLSTPLEAIPVFSEFLDKRADIHWVLGARVQLLGREIMRSKIRHYLGRVFATFVSLTLNMQIYDTQCGAKLIRATPELASIIEDPFVSNWIFDVELLARLIALRYGTDLPKPEALIYEYPLMEWRHIPGSKLRPRHYAEAPLDLFRIRRKYLTSLPKN